MVVAGGVYGLRGSSPSVSPVRFREFPVQIWSGGALPRPNVRSATLQIPAVPLSLSLRPPSDLTRQPFEAVLRSDNPPVQFLVNLQFEDGRLATARGRFQEQSGRWIGECRDWKMEEEFRGVRASATSWPPQPGWQRPEVSGLTRVGRHSLEAYEFRRTLPPRAVLAPRGRHHH